MCGRYTLRHPTLTWRELYAGMFGPYLARPHYNIAPGQPVAVLYLGADGALAGQTMRWGFRPRWLKDPGKVMINARSETAAEKPMFRDAFKRRRCLILADGWYEWRREGTRKQPYFFRLADDTPFTFGGIWTEYEDASGVQSNCAILTTQPAPLAAQVHDRMPVVIEPDDHAEWLGTPGEGRLRFLCRPWLRSDLVIQPVSTRVNTPANDDADCVAPVGDPLLG